LRDLLLRESKYESMASGVQLIGGKIIRTLKPLAQMTEVIKIRLVGALPARDTLVRIIVLLKSGLSRLLVLRSTLYEL
jgi:hypothetical protein